MHKQCLCRFVFGLKIRPQNNENSSTKPQHTRCAGAAELLAKGGVDDAEQSEAGYLADQEQVGRGNGSGDARVSSPGVCTGPSACSFFCRTCCRREPGAQALLLLLTLDLPILCYSQRHILVRVGRRQAGWSVWADGVERLSAGPGYDTPKSFCCPPVHCSQVKSAT